MNVRAYLIEPQKIFVPFLLAALRGNGLDVVATAVDVDARNILETAPDVLFVDLDFFERGGLSTLCRIREAARRLPIVAFSNNEEPTFSASCYICGADAFVSKSAPVEALVKVVRSLVREQSIPSSVAR